MAPDLAARAVVPARSEGLNLYFWLIVGDRLPYKLKRSTWRMTEEDARARHGESAVKVEGSLEVRYPMGQTSDMLADVPAEAIGGRKAAE